MRLLIVEDEWDLRRILARRFAASGYAVDAFETGEEGLRALLSEVAYDAAILDVMLPGMDGLGVLRAAREAGRKLPILLLTARDAVESRVSGLDAGADDYMVKPFSYEELEARIRALARRGPSLHGSVLTVADLTLNPATREVRRGGRLIPLSSREFSMLEYMLHNQGAVLTREQMEAHIWNASYHGASNVVDVYIRYLRRKIDDGHEKKLIHTVRGVGYRLGEEPSCA